MSSADGVVFVSLQVEQNDLAVAAARANVRCESQAISRCEWGNLHGSPCAEGFDRDALALEYRGAQRTGLSGAPAMRSAPPAVQALEALGQHFVVFRIDQGGNAHRHLLGVTQFDDFQFKLFVHDDLLQVEVEYRSPSTFWASGIAKLVIQPSKVQRPPRILAGVRLAMDRAERPARCAGASSSMAAVSGQRRLTRSAPRTGARGEQLLHSKTERFCDCFASRGE
jgi:hypothetical protein